MKILVVLLVREGESRLHIFDQKETDKSRRYFWTGNSEINLFFHVLRVLFGISWTEDVKRDSKIFLERYTIFWQKPHQRHRQILKKGFFWKNFVILMLPFFNFEVPVMLPFSKKFCSAHPSTNSIPLTTLQGKDLKIMFCK